MIRWLFELQTKDKTIFIQEILKLKDCYQNKDYGKQLPSNNDAT